MDRFQLGSAIYLFIFLFLFSKHPSFQNLFGLFPDIRIRLDDAILFMTLQTLCMKKVASLIAMEVEYGAVPGILGALPLLPNEAAAKILALVVRTGHATPLVVR